MMATENDLSRRGSGRRRFRDGFSFSFADWMPHANCASWGCLGLAHGDWHGRSQFSEEDSPNRRRRPGHRLVCCAFVGAVSQQLSLVRQLRERFAEVSPLTRPNATRSLCMPRKPVSQMAC